MTQACPSQELCFLNLYLTFSSFHRLPNCRIYVIIHPWSILCSSEFSSVENFLTYFYSLVEWSTQALLYSWSLLLLFALMYTVFLLAIHIVYQKLQDYIKIMSIFLSDTEFLESPNYILFPSAYYVVRVKHVWLNRAKTRKTCFPIYCHKLDVFAIVDTEKTTIFSYHLYHRILTATLLDAKHKVLNYYSTINPGYGSLLKITAKMKRKWRISLTELIMDWVEGLVPHVHTVK